MNKILIILTIFITFGIVKIRGSEKMLDKDRIKKDDNYYFKYFTYPDPKKYICITKDHAIKLINNAKRQFNVKIDTLYILAVIEKESDYRVRVLGDDGDSVGLMQVSSIALQQVNMTYSMYYTKQELFDPQKNINAGVLYLKWLKKYYGGTPKILYQKYNGGPYNYNTAAAIRNSDMLMQIYQKLINERG